MLFHLRHLSSSPSSQNHSLQTLLKLNLTPTLKSINTFLLSLLCHRKFNLIIHFLYSNTLPIPTDTIPMPPLLHSRSFRDVVSYTMLIDAFSKLGFVEQTFGVLGKMIKEGKRPNRVTYTAIMSGFCRKGKVEVAYSVFERMVDLGIELDEFVFAVLIDGFCRVGDFHSAFHLFDEMPKRGISPGVVTYNSIMNGLCKFQRTSEAYELSKGVAGAADVITYTTLLHGFTKEENVLGVLQTKRWLEEAGIAMDVVMANVLIKALFMMGDFKAVDAFYKQMPEMGLVPNSVTYCTMIDGYCKVGRIDEALHVFDDFRETSISSSACYNSIISGLCKKGMVEMATVALLEFKHKGLEFDMCTYRMLVMTTFTEKGLTGALDLVNRMEGLEPDIYNAVCNDTVFLLCKRRLLEDAYQLCMMMMKKKGSYVTRKSYYAVLRSYLGSVNREQVLPLLTIFLKEYGLVDPMVQKTLACYLCLKDVNCGLRFLGRTRGNSSRVTFPVSILKILIKKGRALDAYKLFMETRDYLLITYVDYAIMIDGLCKGGYLSKALDLCALAGKKRIALNVVVYNSIINCLCHEGRFIEAFRLFDSLEKLNVIPSEVTYATLIYALCREGFLLDAEHVFGKMVLKGFQPKAQVYNSLLEGISKYGQLEKALELLNYMETKYVEPDSLTVSAVINCFYQKHDMEGALEFYSKFKTKDLSPDFFGFLYLMRGLCTKGRMEEARSVLREMLQSKNVVEMINIVNHEVDTNSIGDFLAMLCEQGSIQEALTVLNEIANMLFPVLRLSTYNQGSLKQNNLYEWKDFGSKYSSTRPSPSKSGLDFGYCNGMDTTNLSINSDRYVTRSELHSFDIYYSRISKLCAQEELQKANQLAKECFLT